MGFRRSDLQEAFFVASEAAFRAWGYATADPLEDVLRPGYFQAAGSQARPGELIYLRLQARPWPPVRGAAPEPVRMVLLMAVPGDGRSGMAVRLVQDFGSTAAPAGMAEDPPLRLPLSGAARRRPNASAAARPAAARARRRRPTAMTPGATMPSRRRPDSRRSPRDAPRGERSAPMISAIRGRVSDFPDAVLDLAGRISDFRPIFPRLRRISAALDVPSRRHFCHPPCHRQVIALSGFSGSWRWRRDSRVRSGDIHVF